MIRFPNKSLFNNVNNLRNSLLYFISLMDLAFSDYKGFVLGGTNAIRSAILSFRISYQVAFNIFLSWSQIVLSRIMSSNRHDRGSCLIVIFCFISHQVIFVICYRAPSSIKRGKEACFYLKNLMNSGNSSFCTIMDFSEQIFLFNQLKLLPIA